VAVAVSVSSRLFVAAALALAACDACSQPQPPQPPTTDQKVYGELVEAGCLQATDGGLAAVAHDHTLGPAQPAWLACLYDGGSIQQCAVPCTKNGVVP
jgi:hypothetical protein